MIYRILSDIIVIIHFMWILFVIYMFVHTLIAIIFQNKRFLNLLLLRTVHLVGIVYVTLLYLLDRYCPLTLLEIKLRELAGEKSYTGSFIVHYIEKLLYPEVNPLVVVIPTIVICLFSVVSFILFPPEKIYKIFVLRVKK